MHLVVLRVNGIELPDELPPQLQPYAPLIDLSDSVPILPQPTINSSNDQVDNWATFRDTKLETNIHQVVHLDEPLTSPNHVPKQFSFAPPVADHHRIIAPVAVRLSPPPLILAASNNSTTTTAVKPPPPPPPPRTVTGRTASIDIPTHPILPPRTLVNETPQRNLNLTLNLHNQNSSNTTTPFSYNRTRPSVASTPQQSDANALLGQIRDLLQPDHLQELASIISTPSIAATENLHAALNQTKLRNSILKAQLKHWEDQLTDLIDKRISLELQYKVQQQQQQ